MRWFWTFDRFQIRCLLWLTQCFPHYHGGMALYWGRIMNTDETTLDAFTSTLFIILSNQCMIGTYVFGHSLWPHRAKNKLSHAVDRLFWVILRWSWVLILSLKNSPLSLAVMLLKMASIRSGLIWDRVHRPKSCNILAKALDEIGIRLEDVDNLIAMLTNPETLKQEEGRAEWNRELIVCCNSNKRIESLPVC